MAVTGLRTVLHWVSHTRALEAQARVTWCALHMADDIGLKAVP